MTLKTFLKMAVFSLLTSCATTKKPAQDLQQFGVKIITIKQIHKDSQFTAKDKMNDFEAENISRLGALEYCAKDLKYALLDMPRDITVKTSATQVSAPAFKNTLTDDNHTYATNFNCRSSFELGDYMKPIHNAGLLLFGLSCDPYNNTSEPVPVAIKKACSTVGDFFKQQEALLNTK